LQRILKNKTTATNVMTGEHISIIKSIAIAAKTSLVLEVE
jgi:hypothetical protein